MNSRYDIFPYAFIFLVIVGIAIGMGSFAGNITGQGVIVLEEGSGDSSGTCSGVASSCTTPPLAEEEFLCEAQSGCNWIAGAMVCEGTATACSVYTNETGCEFQAGCNWTIPNVCGDGVLDSESEGCDDGNLVAGDGCSNLCEIEPPIECFGTAMACASLSDEIECGSQLGCEWDLGVAAPPISGAITSSECIGTATQCVTIDTLNDCNNQLGCSLVDATTNNSELNNTTINESANLNETNNNTILNETSNLTADYNSNNNNNNNFSNLTYGNQNTVRTIGEGESCKSSECELEGKCYSIGYRTREKRYCGADTSWAKQKQTTSCLNAFECESYLCESNTCVQRGFGERASARLSCILGDGTCKGTGGYFSRLLGNEKVL